MKLLRVLLVCLFCSVFAVSQPPSASPLRMTARQAAARAKVAKSEFDFQQLAGFYRLQESQFTEASTQQNLAHQYAINHWGAKSYPQAADRARLLSEYYKQRSLQSRRLAESFSQKAELLHRCAGLNGAMNP